MPLPSRQPREVSPAAVREGCYRIAPVVVVVAVYLAVRWLCWVLGMGPNQTTVAGRLSVIPAGLWLWRNWDATADAMFKLVLRK